jgi:uncharacterized protein (DUF1778 family)
LFLLPGGRPRFLGAAAAVSAIQAGGLPRTWTASLGQTLQGDYCLLARAVATQPHTPTRIQNTANCRIIGMVKHAGQTTARLEARLPRDVMKRLKRAAEIRGRTLTDFVVSAADEAACRTLEETEIIRLSLEGQRQIAAAILNPPAPTAALRRAAKRYHDLFGGA